jgi:hypothetical protein
MEHVRMVSKNGMKVRSVYSELNYKLFNSGQEKETVGLGSCGLFIPFQSCSVDVLISVVPTGTT